MSIIACCSFPTTLLLLDDDQDFLKNIKYALSSKYKCTCTPDAAKARDVLIKNRDWTKSLLQEGIERVYNEEDPALLTVSMNVSLLKEKIYDPKRFNHIAIAIVDYDMPEKNGLDFIRSLDDSQIKFIMLTGKAEQSTVIKAFNEREIHRYVSKGDPDYLKTILQYVNELQQEFFLDFSKFILDSLLKGSKTDIFENKSFKELFDKVIRENNIIEYYLLDEFGSFLMQDASAQKQVWLIVKPEIEMQHRYELAQDDSDTPAYVMKNLKNRQLITYFHTLQDGVISAKYWNLIDAHPLDEKKEHYYGIVKNDEDDYFNIDHSRIKSYNEFLKTKGGK